MTKEGCSIKETDNTEVCKDASEEVQLSFSFATFRYGGGKGIYKQR